MKALHWLGSPIERRIAARRTREILWAIFRLLLLSGLAYVMLHPIFYMISVAFRSKPDMLDVTVQWIPKHFTLVNLKRVFTAMKYPGALAFTFGLSTVCALLSTAICSLTAYGLSRFKFKGQGVMFAVVLLTIIVPAAFYRMPSYLIMNKLHLLNSPLSMVLPALLGVGIRSGLYIYLFRQFFKSMPKELEEAAYIDGCGYVKTFTKIMLPSSVPICVTVFLFAFVWYWNDYQLSQLFIQDFFGVRTLSASLANIGNLVYAAFPDVPSGQFDAIQNTLDMQSSSLLVIGPLLLIFLVLQRFFVDNISRTGIVE